MEGLLVINIHNLKGVDAGGRQKWEPPQAEGYQDTYWISLPTVVGPWEIPIERCIGRAETRTALSLNLFHRYISNTVVILE